MSIRIDHIQENDFEALLSLFKEFAAWQKSSDKMINTLEKMKKEKDFLHGFVLRDEQNNLLGYATYFFAYYTWKGKSLYMDDLYIKQECRGKGYGAALIGRVAAFAKENECYRLRWQVSDWNTAAIGFYKSLGAAIDDIERNCDLML